jgi:heme exporter protein D
VNVGSIQGGWEFVWAAYLVSTVVLGGYAVSVILRLRAERARAQREARRTQEVS